MERRVGALRKLALRSGENEKIRLGDGANSLLERVTLYFLFQGLGVKAFEGRCRNVHAKSQRTQRGERSEYI
jgi:hypothetical protein